MYKGSCLCGEITFEIDGGIDSIICCHCSLCRKASGSAYAANGFVDTAAFSITGGESLLGSYQSTPGRYRRFCTGCGSPIFSTNEQDPDRIRIRVGVIDSDIAERPISHNFVTSKANWDILDAELPRYDAYEPGR